MALLAAASLLISAAIAWRGVGGTPPSTLGAFFDGHLYIDIARSFPLPYAPEGRDYLGHAPLYPALLALARALTLHALDWGALAVVASWVASAACVPAFHALAREVDVPATPATAVFAFANPAWLLLSAAPHAEPVAMLAALLCLRACARGASLASGGWLALAFLARYPAILLGAALAFDALVVRRRRDARTLAGLALPLAAFAAYHFYLAWRVPGFRGLWDAHQVQWDAKLTLPFAEMAAYWSYGNRASIQFPIIYASAAFYALATLVGLRPGEWRRAFLAVASGVVAGFHVSLSGEPGVDSFTRLAILAWPPSLLVAFRAARAAGAPAWPSLSRGSRAALAVGLAGVCAWGAWVASRQIRVAIWMQGQRDWMRPKLESLDADAPQWTDFAEIHRRAGGGAPAPARRGAERPALD
ncbi:MAG: hypothetical protein R3E88_13025 [Myxococcota bacterium]